MSPKKILNTLFGCNLALSSAQRHLTKSQLVTIWEELVIEFYQLMIMWWKYYITQKMRMIPITYIYTIMSSLLYNTFLTWLVISFCRITSMFVLIVDFMVKLFNIVDGSCCFDAIWAVLAVLAGIYFFVYFHFHL